MEVPVKKENIDSSGLVELCEHYINCKASGERFKDGEHYIFEKALETVFGADVWQFVNSIEE